ncbi:MAG TPA: hypothetical protein VFQ47_00030 [Nitrososphaera sp.]|jgi:hypothetical protein|nr:hypothetical protein [Nitrososphaera sp.]
MGRDETWRESAYAGSVDHDDYGDYVEGNVFVGMAFDLPSNLSDTFQAIKRACATAGLNAVRVDDIQDSGPIPVQILKAIEDAEFLIFDLTVERPNVYYELGYAHGAGNRSEEIILVAKSGTKIHFDVAHLRITYYDSAIDLEQKLLPKFKYMIEHYRS